MKAIPHNRKNEAGFTLLELLLVVGVGAILLLAGIGTFQLVSQGNNVNEASRLLATIKSGVQGLYQGQTTYGTSGTSLDTILVNAGVFPPNALDGTTPITPWNTNIDIVAEVANFTIEFNDLPQEACIQMFTNAISTDTDFVQVIVTGGTASAAPTLAEANTDCSATATSNDVVWTFF